MKVSKSLSKILNNEYVLYFVLILAGINILGYLLHGKVTSIVFFALVSYLTYHFSKNLIIVFAVAIFVTSLIHISVSVREGLENASSSTDDTTTDKDTNTKDTDKDTDKDTIKDTTTKDTTTIKDTTTDKDTTTTKDKKKNTDTTVKPTDSSLSTKEEGMNVMSNKKRNRIDYASTIEDAYDDLDRILGGDGIKQLTDDTQKLMGQQVQLADAMKQMTPLLENAKSMLKGFDMSSLSSIAGFAKNFGGGASGP